MTANEIYLSMFSFLDSYWQINRSDELGILLGSMSPHLFSNGLPIDPTIMEDWNTIFGEKMVENGDLVQQSFECMITFLQVQQRNFSIDLHQLLIYLNDVNDDKVNYISDWENWVKELNRYTS